MKNQIVFVFYVLCVLSSIALVIAETDTTTPRKQCEEVCPTTIDRVCGYDSICYARFDNKCTYDKLKCTVKRQLETVDMSLCDLAERRTHPDYRLC